MGWVSVWMSGGLEGWREVAWWEGWRKGGIGDVGLGLEYCVCVALIVEWLGLNWRESVWGGMSDGVRVHTRMLKYGIILRVCSADCTEWLGLFGERVFGEKSLTVYIHVC